MRGNSASEQIAAVAKLRELNSGFDGTVTGWSGKGMPKIENGVVTEFGFHTDNVFDLSPVRARSQLTKLRCRGTGDRNGKLADLSPLQGLKLTALDCGEAPLLESLQPLKGMPLMSLSLSDTSVPDLSPLAGMPLTYLILRGHACRRLKPNRGHEAHAL